MRAAAYLSVQSMPASEVNRFDNCLMVDAAVEFVTDPIPVITFGQHVKDVLDEEAGTLKGQLSTTDLRIGDYILAELFAFLCSHASLRLV